MTPESLSDSLALYFEHLTTATKMKECVWLKPQLAANFEFLEWAESNHARHIRFVG